jgi:hypothetical protein
MPLKYEEKHQKTEKLIVAANVTENKLNNVYLFPTSLK